MGVGESEEWNMNERAFGIECGEIPTASSRMIVTVTMLYAIVIIDHQSCAGQPCVLGVLPGTAPRRPGARGGDRQTDAVDGHWHHHFNLPCCFTLPRFTHGIHRRPPEEWAAFTASLARTLPTTLRLDGSLCAAVTDALLLRFAGHFQLRGQFVSLGGKSRVLEPIAWYPGPLGLIHRAYSGTPLPVNQEGWMASRPLAWQINVDRASFGRKTARQAPLLLAKAAKQQKKKKKKQQQQKPAAKMNPLLPLHGLLFREQRLGLW